MQERVMKNYLRLPEALNPRMSSLSLQRAFGHTLRLPARSSDGKPKTSKTWNMKQVRNKGTN
jgi:hypothetical protein